MTVPGVTADFIGWTIPNKVMHMIKNGFFLLQSYALRGISRHGPAACLNLVVSLTSFLMNSLFLCTWD